MDRKFGFAFGISAFIHSAVFLPFFAVAVPKQEVVVNKPIIVDYVKNEKPVEDKKETVKSRISPKQAETPKLELSKDVEMKEKRSAAELLKNREDARRQVRELAKRQADVRSTKDYINYYQLIREKIRGRLKGHYRNYHTEGDVVLIFMVNSAGSVEAVEVETALSTRDPDLIRVAIASVRESSPFPPFPRELAYPQVAFDLTVSFKKQ